MSQKHPPDKTWSKIASLKFYISHELQYAVTILPFVYDVHHQIINLIFSKLSLFFRKMSNVNVSFLKLNSLYRAIS